MRKFLPIVALALAACAPKTDAVKEPEPMRNDEQRPLGGWGPLQEKMNVMLAEADAIIAEAKAASGDPLERYRDAEMRIFFAMRPEFGPANAALPRDRKMQDLATALGIPQPTEPVPADLDAFVAQVRAAAETLRARGWKVEESVASTRAVLWREDVRGWRLTVIDPSREVDEFVPYSSAPSTKKVNPSVSLWFFPRLRIRSSESMVKREQPGAVEAAGPGAVMMRLPAPQSRDQDDGELAKAVFAALALGGASRELPDLAKQLGAGTATLSNGVVTVTVRELPGNIPPVSTPGAHAVIWTVQRGPNVDRILLPTE